MHEKILIIGNQGYLGSRLSDYLQENGYSCTGADTGFFQYGVLYRPKPINMLAKEARTINKKDIEGFDVVILLAGISNDPFGDLDPRLIYDPTREYALRIAKICKNLGVRFIFPSSCSVYGIGSGRCDEMNKPNPQTLYSRNKLEIEEDLARLADESFSPIALRLATVFGPSPRMRFDVVINMLCGMALTTNKIVLNSNGQAWRPHLYIEDACQAFHCCIAYKYTGGKLLILNVGDDDNNWKIIDIAKTIQSFVDGCDLKFLGEIEEKIDNKLFKDKKIDDGVDKRTYQVSFKLIHEILPSFKASWDVKRGIKELIQALKFWHLDEIKFKQLDFYRLQQLDFLYKTNQIDQNLNWLEK